MESFNISEFDKNAVGGIYNIELEDGTLIKQFGDNTGYVENVIPAQGWYYIQKEFFENGALKSKGSLFKRGDFKAGIWIEFNMEGVKITETNYDILYKNSLESILKILNDQKIPFSISDMYNTIRRNSESGMNTWYVEWKILPNRLERIEIDDSTSKIIKKYFVEFEEDH